jgi:hypothetical protein
MFTNAILPHRTPAVNRSSWWGGAASFRRMLGGCLKALKTRLLEKVRDDIVEIDDSPCQLKRGGLK